jgi:hypothetical protein
MLLLIAFVTTPLRADPTPSTTTTPSSNPYDLPQGLWTFSTYGAFAAVPSSDRENIYSGVIGLGYYFIPNNSLSIELTGLTATQDGNDVTGGGANLLLRTNLLNTSAFSGFIDFGPGIVQTNHRFPEGGTDFNFYFKTGFGAEIHLSNRTDLLTGIRYLHVSNARIDGPARNPSINTIEAYLGVIFKL